MAACGAAALADWFDVPGLPVLGLAMVPALLAGAWAGEHPEIREWPRARLIAMWVLAGAACLAASDLVHYVRLTAAIIAAPVALLSFRWYELNSGPPEPAALPPSTTTTDAVTAPQSPPGAPPS
jgi:hypothetical protein